MAGQPAILALHPDIVAPDLIRGCASLLPMCQKKALARIKSGLTRLWTEATTPSLHQHLRRLLARRAIRRLDAAELGDVDLGLGVNAARVAELAEAFDAVIVPIAARAKSAGMKSESPSYSSRWATRVIASMRSWNTATISAGASALGSPKM